MIEVKHTFICDICAEEHKTTFTHYEGGEMPNVQLPLKWSSFRGMTLCPKHEVKRVTLIDGREIESRVVGV
jgi:hypothetical protein